MKCRCRAVPLMIAFFACLAQLPAQERTVNIESARSTEYFSGKNDDGGEDEIVRFSGAVSISITEGKSKSVIFADEVVYNKTRDTLEASGSVKYEHSSGSRGSEVFTGKSLLINIKKREGVFLDGNLVQNTGRKNSDPYIIKADASGRDSGSTIAFKNAILTTCEEENPHWTINASRIWLLPGNEIGILNGILRIGPLPVFYIPVFYYPSDEMIVHPVFGFRNRQGYFVQTTTYLHGRKPLPQKKAGSGTSFTDFLQGDTLKEQRREGLFFRNLDSDATNQKADYVKLMVDGYSSMGAMAGLDGSLTFPGYLKSLSFSVFAAFSETLYKPASGVFYSPFSDDGSKKMESSWLFGVRIPVRYKSNASVKVDKKPFSASLSIPLLSDPFFRQDFLDRSEDLNWFTLLTEQNALAVGASLSEETSASWNFSGSIQPDTGFLTPWITQLSVSSITGLLSVNSKTNTDLTGQEALYSSERKFFYPELIKHEISLSIAGTIIDSAGGTKDSRMEVSVEKAQSPDDGRISIDTARLTDPFKTESATPPGDDHSGSGSVPDPKTFDSLFPKLGNVTDTPAQRKEDAFDYSLKWSLNPSLLQEYRYDSSQWNTPADINWNSFASVFTNSKNSGKLTATARVNSGMLTFGSTLNLTTLYQNHPWLSDSVYQTQSKKDSVLLADMKNRTLSVTSTNSVAVAPFIRNELLKPVSVSWNLNNTVVKSSFDPESTLESPEWKTEWMKWKKNFISSHTASATAGIVLGAFEQKVSLVSNLDPLLEAFSWTSSFTWPYSSLKMSTRLFEKENDAKKWFWDPFTSSFSVKLPVGIQGSASFSYNIEDDKPLQLKFTGSWGFLSGSYTLSDSLEYVLEEGTGWVAKSESRTFIPTSAGFTLSNGSKPIKFNAWKNRIQTSSTLSSSFTFNLLKLTESSFSFTPAVTCTIFEFIDIKFSSSSKNDSIARYYQNMMDLEVPFPGEQNILIDLLKSFNFFNEQDRTSSGFKLSSLNLDVVHHLHDWTLNFKTSVKPELDKDAKKYKFEPTISLVVQWKPISDIKTSIKSEKGVFTLNTASDEE